MLLCGADVSVCQPVRHGAYAFTIVSGLARCPAGSSGNRNTYGSGVVPAYHLVLNAHCIENVGRFDAYSGHAELALIRRRFRSVFNHRSLNRPFRWCELQTNVADKHRERGFEVAVVLGNLLIRLAVIERSL
jgi:hypothetical protein